jgi:mRNA interferase MazF
MNYPSIDRGDIFWVPADPQRGSVPGSPHPHVVVQDDVFNHSRISTVVVCALSSNLNRASEPGNILLEPGEGNLERRSVVIVSQVSSLYKFRLGERIGSLSDSRVDQIVAGLRFVQSAFIGPRK